MEENASYYSGRLNKTLHSKSPFIGPRPRFGFIAKAFTKNTRKRDPTDRLIYLSKKDPIFLKRTKPVLQIAGPMALANLSVPMLGLVDTAILGHLENASILAAAALGAHIITLVFWSFGFLRMSTTGLTGRLYGAEKYSELKTALVRALLIAVLLASFILLIGQLGLSWLAHLLGGGSGVAELSSTYMQIRVWSAPATLATYCFVGCFIGLGKTRHALAVLLVANITNGLLDYLLIVKLQMDIRGAAYASLIAEYIGLTTAALLCVSIFKKDLFAQAKISDTFNPVKLREILQAHLDLFLRTISLLLVFLIVTTAGVRISPEVAAANAILLNLLSFSAHAIDGFAYAAEALCGRAWGKRDFEEFWLVAKESTLYSLLLGIAFVLAFLLLQQPILSLYTNLPEVILEANKVYLWLALLPMVALWCYQLDGIFIGIGHTQSMRNSMLFSFLLIFLPLFFFTQDLGNAGVWLALSIFYLARVISLGVPLVAIYQTQKKEA
tara:strand:+ start:44597 stop:46087 length:1491 start_codon:yes stop_codon:yes gene_type:complete